MTTQNSEPLISIVEPICRAHGLELVQLRQLSEGGDAVLRVLIDRLGAMPDDGASGSTVTVSDCQAVSRELGVALEEEDVVGGAYRLEVSSPGLNRPLVKLEHFERFSGRKVEIRTQTALPDGRGKERRKFKGQLLGVDGEVVRLSVDGAELLLPHAAISRANVVHEY